MTDDLPNDHYSYHNCPTCNAVPGKKCRTAAGRLKNSTHDNRPFDLHLPSDYSRTIPREEEKTAEENVRELLDLFNNPVLTQSCEELLGRDKKGESR